MLNKLERSLFYLTWNGSPSQSHSLILTSILEGLDIRRTSNLFQFKLKFSEKYYQAEGLIKLTFVTNLRKEYIYASYYVNRTPSIEHLQKQGIEIHDLEK